MPLKLLFTICLLRANPQDLPVSRALMLTSLAAYGITDVIGALDVMSVEHAVLTAALDTLLLAAAVYLALHWRKLDNRFPQTLSALAGAGAVLSLCAWVIAGLTREWLPPLWLWGPLLVWYILVFGHVLRHAFSIPLAAGVAVTLLYLILLRGMLVLIVNPVPVVN